MCRVIDWHGRGWQTRLDTLPVRGSEPSQTCKENPCAKLKESPDIQTRADDYTVTGKSGSTRVVAATAAVYTDQYKMGRRKERKGKETEPSARLRGEKALSWIVVGICCQWVLLESHGVWNSRDHPIYRLL